MENKKENKKIENNEEINSEWFENNGYKLPEDLIDYDSDYEEIELNDLWRKVNQI